MTCCLVEQEIPRKSRKAYSGGFLQSYNPKKLQKKAREYSTKILPNVIHGKFEASDYSVIRDKRSVWFVSARKATDIANEFQTLADQWKKDTLGISSVSDMVMHPAYQRIMALGKAALPFILQDLQQSGGHWFHALNYIVGEDVAAGTNTVADARAAWLEWGYKNGHI